MSFTPLDSVDAWQRQMRKVAPPRPASVRYPSRRSRRSSLCAMIPASRSDLGETANTGKALMPGDGAVLRDHSGRSRGRCGGGRGPAATRTVRPGTDTADPAVIVGPRRGPAVRGAGVEEESELLARSTGDEKNRVPRRPPLSTISTSSSGSSAVWPRRRCMPGNGWWIVPQVRGHRSAPDRRTRRCPAGPRHR